MLAAQLIARWAHVYSDDKAVSAAVTYVHLTGILLGGGVAVAADRGALRLARGGADDASPAGDPLVHRWVVVGLGLIVASGLLMMLADLHTYVTSTVFWVKMGLTLLLVGNGYVRLQAERAVVKGVRAARARLQRTSIASLVLWFVILLAGTMLVSAD